MKDHNRLIIFIIFSFCLHTYLVFHLKPSFFLFSDIQNIKLKKNITKVKLVKIVEKPKPKPKPKIIPKIQAKQEPKPKIHSKPKPEKKKTTPQKPKKEHKTKKTVKIKKKQKPKIKTTKKNTNKSNVIIKKEKKISKKQKKKVKKVKKLDLSRIKKKIAEIKKREKRKEELLKKEEERKRLKQEAAYFYSNRIKNLIQSLWNFPKFIKDEELPYLKIKVKLRVDKNGKVIGKPVILEKSKNKFFNDSALIAIEKLNMHRIPLPPIINDKYIDIILTLTPPEQ
jgi:hypothetical protein